MFTTVQLPLMDDRLSRKKIQQLNRLTARDTTVIQRYLEIITLEEEHLWRVGWEGKRLDKIKLDALTLTSKAQKRSQKDGTVHYTQGRLTVQYDLKAQFGRRITVRELKECRDTAVEMWHAYREKVNEHERRYWRILQNPKYIDKEDQLARVLHWWATQKKPTPPCQAANYTPRKLPRRANMGITAFLQERPTKLTRSWLELYCPEQRKHLWLPLNPSSYHQNQLLLGPIKTVQLVKHKNKRWYAHCTIKIIVPKEKSEKNSSGKPLAVFAHDLGLKKTSVAVLLTETGTLTKDQLWIFKQPTKQRKINALDNRIASIQRRYAAYQTQGKSTKSLTRLLKQIAEKRQRLAVQYDHELTAQIVRLVQQLTHHYTLYVALGRLKGIRRTRWKGDGGSRQHRRELHRWAFARLTAMLEYKLARIGFPLDQFRVVSEAWTSRTCSRCGTTDTLRPTQGLFLCQTCGLQLNADINGAKNIGFRLIKSLDGTSLDQWSTKASIMEAGEVGWKQRCRPRTQQASVTSRPRSGNETPSPVELSAQDLGVEPANRKCS
ncbi:MAG: RNA-guided endonuclease InsQ/TnpB family protein [Candidatus Hodarchaeales archaeon]|jgi:IS605 OrfB family transposase